MADGNEARASRHQRVGAAVVFAAAFAVLVWTGGGSSELTTTGRASRSAVDGLVSGIFVAGAVIAALHGGRGHDRPRTGLVAALGVTAALGHTRRERCVADVRVAMGMGLGLLAAGHLTLTLPIPIASPVTTTMEALVWLAVTTQAAAVALVVAVVPRRTVALLAATASVVSSLLLLRITPLAGSLLDLLLSLGLAAVGAAWLAVFWLALPRAAERSVQRAPDEIDRAAVASSRDQREQLHELRSTVAGLVSGSALIEDPAVPLDVRFHMWESVRSELDRMQRLLTSHDRPACAIDLDEVLSPVLDMQRSKGRRVELHTSGDQVQGRHDALAEVVNILLDNAATHGGCDTSRVDVVRRDDDTVDISVTDDGRGVPDELRDHIFDWGDRREDSPGEGIGLSLARRLVSRDGGTLRLVPAREASGSTREASGSTFVISLPAVRRSEENFISEGDPHVTRRCPS